MRDAMEHLAIPDDIRETAWQTWQQACLMSLHSDQVEILARAILAERERCAEIIEHRPLAIPDRQELAAYIRSGWHSIFSPGASIDAALSPAGEK